MKTSLSFVVSKEKEWFDWNKFLSQNCEEMKDLIYDYKITEKSASWVTCACGSQCAIIPRSDDGQPMDYTLKELGESFHTEGIMPMVEKIRNENFDEANMYRKDAIGLLEQIEERSAFLIEHELNKLRATIKRYSE